MPQEDQYETTGVNTLEQLKELEKYLVRNGDKNKIESITPNFIKFTTNIFNHSIFIKK